MSHCPESQSSLTGFNACCAASCCQGQVDIQAPAIPLALPRKKSRRFMLGKYLLGFLLFFFLFATNHPCFSTRIPEASE